MRSIILRFVYASVTFGTIFDIEVEKNNKKFTVFLLFTQKEMGYCIINQKSISYSCLKNISMQGGKFRGTRL